MIFLIEYDRRKGCLVTFTTFDDSERGDAEKARLDLELNRNRAQAHREVVLLEAATEEALRKTHRRYFQNTREIIEAST